MNQPNIAAIACQDLKGGIGMNNGDLPWPKHNKDMAFFKHTTLNSVCIIGKNTYLSLLKFKKTNTTDPLYSMSALLKNRLSIVVTSDPLKLNFKAALVSFADGVYDINHAYAVTNIDHAIEAAKKFIQSLAYARLGEWNSIFIIGGAQLYKAAATYVDTLYLNIIQGNYNADIAFPHDAYKHFRIKTVTHLADDLVSLTLKKDDNV